MLPAVWLLTHYPAGMERGCGVECRLDLECCSSAHTLSSCVMGSTLAAGGEKQAGAKRFSAS